MSAARGSAAALVAGASAVLLDFDGPLCRLFADGRSAAVATDLRRYLEERGAPVPDDGSAFRALRTISAAGFVVGGAGIGTWLGLLLTTPTPRANTEHPRVSPWTPVVGMGSAGARYVF